MIFRKCIGGLFMAGKYVIRKTNAGFKFDLKSSNGEVVATSMVYSSVAECKSGAELVRTIAAAEIEDQTLEDFEKKECPKYEIYLDKCNEYRFRLKNASGDIIVVGEGYKSKANCKNGIASIKKHAPDAEVVELSKLLACL
jgi:uncharacterized protein YegP (UPF0339 family)